jgi:hypothetical protein
MCLLELIHFQPKYFGMLTKLKYIIMKRILYTTMVLFSLTMSSCLKDKGQSSDYYDGVENTIIEFVEASKSPNRPSTNTDPATQPLVYVSAGQPLPLIEEFPSVRIRLGGFTNSNMRNINYSIAINNALVSEYNTAHNTNYTLFPAGALSIIGLTGTIPAGSDEAQLKIRVDKSSLSLTESYAVGLIINSSDATVNSNANKIVLNFSIKNKYDGVYDLRVKTVGWGAYTILDGITKDYPQTGDGLCIGLVTAGPSDVTFYNYVLESDLLPAFSTTGPTQFGATTPKFTFDPNTNRLLNVQNTSPDDGRGRKLSINPLVTDSRFDPATKTVYAAFIMKQNGRPDQYIYDTLTFTGDRP